jgi:hypothetical protein
MMKKKIKKLIIMNIALCRKKKIISKMDKIVSSFLNNLFSLVWELG